MGLITDNRLQETRFTTVCNLTVFVLSEPAECAVPLMETIQKLGCSANEVNPETTSEFDPENSILLIHDSNEDRIAHKILDTLMQPGLSLDGVHRILLTPKNDQLKFLKKNIYQCDLIIESDLETEDDIENVVEGISQYKIKTQGSTSDPLDWRQLSRNLIDVVFQGNKRRELIRDINSLAILIKEYEYTLKSALKLIADSFNAPLVSVFTKSDNTLYTLVINSISAGYVKSLQEYLLSSCQYIEGEHSEVIWGRRLIKNETGSPDNDIENKNFLLIPLEVKDQVLGCIAIPCDDNEDHDDYFLRLIGHQTAILVYTSLLYRSEHRLVQNHFLRLGAINEVCRLFSDLDSKDFGLQFLLILLEHILADKGFLALMDDKGRITTLHSIGFDEETQEWLMTDENAIPWKSTWKGDNAKSGSVNIPLREEKGKVAQLFYIGYPLFDVQGKLGVIFILFKTEPDYDSILPFYQTMVTLASTHFANIGLYEQYMEKRLMEEQINIARDIQRELLPKHTPELPDFTLAASSRSATQVGGDFYDFVELPDGKHVIVIGDVSGKGIPASQLMAMTKSLLKFRLQQGTSLPHAMGDINNYLTNETPAEKFVTALALLIDQEKKSIDVVNAGHGSLMIYRAAERDFEQIDVDGLALGILNDVDYSSKHTSYSSGDIFLLFTDGLHEAMSPTREQFGLERIKTIAREMLDSPASKILNRLFKAITKHAEGMPQHDDTTIIIMKVK